MSRADLVVAVFCSIGLCGYVVLWIAGVAL